MPKNCPTGYILSIVYSQVIQSIIKLMGEMCIALIQYYVLQFASGLSKCGWLVVCLHNGYYQGRIERRGHATHRNIEIFIVTNIRFYAHADVTSCKVH